MAERMTVDQLEVMAESLRLYDVVDGGWEGDPESANNPRSVADNIQHVGNHLSRTLAFKDFTSTIAIVEEIAPDFVQYGLRLSRWIGVSTADLVTKGAPHIQEARQINNRLGIQYPATLPVVSLIYANGILSGEQMRDEGHDELYERAVIERPEKIKQVGQVLINTAFLYSKDLRFDLKQAFDERISQLRIRHNIPRIEES